MATFAPHVGVDRHRSLFSILSSLGPMKDFGLDSYKPIGSVTSPLKRYPRSLRDRT